MTTIPRHRKRRQGLHHPRPTRVGLALAVSMIVAGGGNETRAQSVDPPAVHAPLAPADAEALFQVEPGLRIELVVAEPLVVDPVEIAFDKRGRMWVVEMGDYPNGPDKDEAPRGRIKILEDRDGDGSFDTATVFADGLLFANGLLPWRDGAIVTSAPSIDWLRDTDGDGVADVREPLYRGFATENVQLRVSQPTFGIDNWIYVANGLRGGKVVAADRPDDEPIDLSGRDFRFDPMRGTAEAVSGMGQFGLTFDAWGRRFVCDNRNHLRHVVFPERHARANPYLAIPGVVQDVSVLGVGPGGSGGRVYPISRTWTTSSLHVGRFTAACGVHVYLGDALGKPFEGAAFTCEPTGNLVHMETLEPRGATFQSRPHREGVEFLASPDPWFRPVNLAEGPDGALYVVDMYRAVIEHPEWMPDELKNRPDLNDGNDRGRIWRIVPEGGLPTRSGPALDTLGGPELIEQLGHPNGWHRDTAQRLLHQDPDSDVRGSLADAAHLSANPQTRVRALWLLESRGRLPVSLLLNLLRAEHPRVREHAVLLAESHLGGWLWDGDIALDYSALIRDLVLELSTDPDARVRYQVALSLGVWDNDAKVAPLAAIALAGADDPWTRLAVASAVPERSGLLIRKLLERLADQNVPTSGQRDLIRELSSQIGARHDATEVQMLYDTLSALSGPDATLHRLSALTGLAEGLNRAQTALLTYTETMPATDAESPSTHLRAMLEDAADLVPRIDDPEIRRDVIDLMASAPWDLADPVLAPFLEGSSPEVGQAVARAYGAHRHPEVADRLLDAWESYLPALRRAVVDAMLRDPARTRRLLTEIESGRLAPGDLDPAQAQRFQSHADPEIKALAGTLLNRPGGRREAIERYQAAVTMAGDASRGRSVFEKNCATCHRVGDLGIDVGPDIADTRVRTREALLGDILDPNRAIDGNYVGYVVATRDGTVFDGVIAAETASSVTLRGPEGKTEVILRNTIEELRSTGKSLMPEGLEANIAVEEMADLLSYLKDWRYQDGDVPVVDAGSPRDRDEAQP